MELKVYVDIAFALAVLVVCVCMLCAGQPKWPGKRFVSDVFTCNVMDVKGDCLSAENQSCTVIWSITERVLTFSVTAMIKLQRIIKPGELVLAIRMPYAPMKPLDRYVSGLGIGLYSNARYHVLPSQKGSSEILLALHSLDALDQPTELIKASGQLVV